MIQADAPLPDTSLWLQQAVDHAKANHWREAEDLFQRVELHDPHGVQQVADAYAQLALHAPTATLAKRCARAAKNGYKLVAPNLHNPLSRGDVHCRMGQQYALMSTAKDYSAHHTERAIVEFTSAVEAVGQTRMPSAHAGRLNALLGWFQAQDNAFFNHFGKTYRQRVDMFYTDLAACVQQPDASQDETTFVALFKQLANLQDQRVLAAMEDHLLTTLPSWVAARGWREDLAWSLCWGQAQIKPSARLFTAVRGLAQHATLSNHMVEIVSVYRSSIRALPKAALPGIGDLHAFGGFATTDRSFTDANRASLALGFEDFLTVFESHGDLGSAQACLHALQALADCTEQAVFPALLPIARVAATSTALGETAAEYLKDFPSHRRNRQGERAEIQRAAQYAGPWETAILHSWLAGPQ